jgi:hypothetical protein
LKGVAASFDILVDRRNASYQIGVLDGDRMRRELGGRIVEECLPDWRVPASTCCRVGALREGRFITRGAIS